MLSSPAILSFIVSTLNMAIDRIFIGKAVGTKALAAVTVALGIQTLIQAISQIIASGASSLIALDLGKNNKNNANLIIGNSFSLSIIVSIILTTFGLIFLKPILIAFGASNEIMYYASLYSFIMIGSTILFFISQVTNNIIRGMGYAKTAMLNFLGSVITNTIFDIVFIFAFNMGVKGAAFATSIGYIVSGIMSLRFIVYGKSVGKLKISNLKINCSIAKKILKVGMPALIMQLSLSIITVIFNHLCNIYGGATAQAVYGIINILTMFVYMPVMGLSMGIQSIIGVNYGAGYYDRVKETLIKSFKYSTIFCIAVFLSMEFLNNEIAWLFGGSNSIEFFKLASKAIQIVGISIPVIGFELVSANYFQYIGKAADSILFISLKQIIFLIPAVFILPLFTGIMGIFTSSVVADILTFVIMTFFFVKEFKKLRCNINTSKLYN